MPNADALVAVAAVDLEDLFKTAHDQALQIELGRDAQVHLLIERVVVGDEGFGVGTTGDGVQHRCFHFQKTVLDHELAHAADGAAACHKALAGLLIGDEVYIALAVFELLIGHAVEFIGQRAQALGHQPYAFGVDRELAGLGLEQGAAGGDDVAQVPMLEGLVGAFAYAVIAHINLDAPARGAQRRVLNGGKAGFAHDPLEHHAAGHAHLDGFFLQLFFAQAVVLGEQIGRTVLGLDVVGKGDALLAQGGELVAALGHQLVVVGGEGALFSGGHGAGRHARGARCCRSRPSSLQQRAGVLGQTVDFTAQDQPLRSSRSPTSSRRTKGLSRVMSCCLTSTGSGSSSHQRLATQLQSSNW